LDKYYRNLGPKSKLMLAKAGIETDAQLMACGSITAYLAVKRAGCSPGLNLLWALEGALSNRDWKDVARNDRLSLFMQFEDAEKIVNQ